MPTILIIEDSLLMRETLKQMLEFDKYTVLEAEDGPTGISLAREKRPNLVILDLMMPYMSGMEVLKYLRGDPVLYNIPVIILSAVNQPEQVMNVLELKVNDYLLKPVDHLTLKQRVEAALSGSGQNLSPYNRA